MFDLSPHNTFKIRAYCSEFVDIESEAQLISIIKEKKTRNKEILILGSGSNILFTKNYEGIVLKNCIKGVEIINQNENYVFLKVSSGEIWNELVDYCVKNNWGGIENLSLIPGTVGAAPVQNIGAYGVEIKDSLVQLEAIDIISGKKVEFTNSQCKFGYRDSIFKNEAKNKYFITNITLKLNKKPVLNTSYGDICKTITFKGISIPNLKNVSDAIKEIRMSKLPDPSVVGNAGSFFKNPVIEVSHFEKLKEKYPDVKYFSDKNGKVKIAAAWLIEKAELKGYSLGNAKIHDLQPLVIVNTGNASGEEIKNLAYYVIKTINEKFGIALSPEVNIL